MLSDEVARLRVAVACQELRSSMVPARFPERRGAEPFRQSRRG